MVQISGRVKLRLATSNVDDLSSLSRRIMSPGIQYKSTMSSLRGPIETVVSELKAKHILNDLGEVHLLLSIEVRWTPDTIAISQTAYIDKILAKFGMSEDKWTSQVKGDQRSPAHHLTRA